MSLPELKKSSERSSNFELLRIISMLMIIASHAAQHSGRGDWNLITLPFSLNSFFLYTFGTYGQCGVILFVIISSWFLCEAKGIHIKKALNLYLLTLFYSILIFVFVKIANLGNVGLKHFVKTLLTPAYSGYWFIKTYILFYLFVPYAQKFLQSLDEETHRKFLLAFTIFLPVMKFFISGMGSEFGNIGDFFYIFTAVYYLKKHENNFFEKHCRIICLCLFCLLWASLCTANILCYRLNFDEKIVKRILTHIYASRHIFVMMLSMSIFYIFKNYVKTGNSKIINTIAKTTLGIYVLHEAPLFHSYGENGIGETAILFEQWLKIGKHFSEDSLFPVYFLFCTVSVFVICFIIEFIRQSLCRIFARTFKKAP